MQHMKRKLLFLALMCLTSAAAFSQISLGFPGPGAPSVAPSFVQATSCHGGVGTGNCTTPPISVTSGHGLFFCTEYNGSATLSSMTISTGTGTLASFTTLFTPTTINSTSLDCRYLLSTDASGSTTFKATWSATAGTLQLYVYEFVEINGLDATAPAITSSFTTGQTIINCPNYTTTHAGALVVCVGMTTSGLTTATASSGFTIPSGGSQVIGAGTGSNGATEYQARVGAGTALTPSITISSANGTFGISFAFY